jgi:hypothetical protein
MRPAMSSATKIGAAFGVTTLVFVVVVAIAVNTSSTAIPRPSPVAAPSTPVVPDPPAAASPAPAKKLTARERKAADVEAGRLADEAFCGPRPEKAWDSYIEAEDAFKKIANDPGSVDFTACADAVRKPMPLCWSVLCDVRAKNMFGALILRRVGFSASAAGGWRILAK